MDEEQDAAAPTHLLLSSYRAGPFISATTHELLQLGQRPALAAGSDDDDYEEELAGSSMQAPGGSSGALSSSAGRAARGGGAGGRRGAPTLRDLVDAGVTAPGRNNITVVYKGVTYTASLGREGLILYQGRKFATASAFSIHCKRLQTPGKQGDDGWKSVLYEGQPLERFRRRLAAARAAAPPARAAPAGAPDADEDDAERDGGEGAAEAAEGGGAAAAAPAADVAVEAAEPATDQWVQCDRCRTWRIVPDAAWPSVEADPRDVWFCEDASWDVQQYHPQTEPCVSR